MFYQRTVESTDYLPPVRRRHRLLLPFTCVLGLNKKRERYTGLCALLSAWQLIYSRAPLRRDFVLFI